MTQATAEKDLKQEELYDAIERERNIEDEQLTQEQMDARDLAESMAGLGSLDNLVQKATEEAFAETYTTKVAFDQAVVDEMSSDAKGAADEVGNAINAYNVDITAILELPSGTEAEKKAKEDAVRAANQKIVDLQDAGFLTEKGDAADLLEMLAGSIVVDEETAALMTAVAFADGIVDPADLSLDYLGEVGLLTIPEDADEGIPEFGDMSMNQLQGILGDEFKTLSVAEIANIVENKVLTEIHQTANLQKTISDPNVSPVLREALEGQLAQVEASGFAAIEQDASDAASQVLAAGSVLFGGEVREITELLDDSTITTMVEDYFLLDEDKRADSPFFKDNPAFANAMNETFAGAMKQGQTFADAVEEFKAVNKEFADSIAADIKEMGLDAPNPNIQELFGRVNPPKGLVATIPTASAFWTSALDNPSVMKSMNGWDQDTVDTFGEWMKENATKKGAYDTMLDVLESPGSALAFMEMSNIDKTLKDIPVGSDSEEQDLMNTLFGMNTTFGGIATGQFAGVDADMYLAKLKFDAVGGDPVAREAYEKMQDVLDVAPKDGIQDSPEQMRTNIKEWMKSGSMEEMAINAQNMAATRNSISQGDKRSGDDIGGSYVGAVKDLTVRDNLFAAGVFDGRSMDHDKAIDFVNSKFPTSDDREGKIGYLESILHALPRAGTMGSKIRELIAETQTEMEDDIHNSPSMKAYRTAQEAADKEQAWVDQDRARWAAPDGDQYKAWKHNPKKLKDHEAWLVGKETKVATMREDVSGTMDGVEDQIKTWESNGSPSQKIFAAELREKYGL
jgi:hypothetical protein